MWKHESDILQMLIYQGLENPQQPLDYQAIVMQAVYLGEATLRLWSSGAQGGRGDHKARGTGTRSARITSRWRCYFATADLTPACYATCYYTTCCERSRSPIRPLSRTNCQPCLPISHRQTAKIIAAVTLKAGSSGGQAEMGLL